MDCTFNVDKAHDEVLHEKFQKHFTARLSPTVTLTIAHKDWDKDGELNWRDAAELLFLWRTYNKAVMAWINWGTDMAYIAARNFAFENSYYEFWISGEKL